MGGAGYEGATPHNRRPPHTAFVAGAQISWGEAFEQETARALFGSNLLALTWIKGEPLPGDLVTDVLRGLGLEQESFEEWRKRTSGLSAAPNLIRSRGSIERLRDNKFDDGEPWRAVNLLD